MVKLRHLVKVLSKQKEIKLDSVATESVELLTTFLFKQNKMKISNYLGGKNKELIDLFTCSFSDSEGEDEGVLIGALVKNLLNTTPKINLRVCIAQNNSQIIGSVFFTKLTFEHSDANTWLLSPAAVRTQFQGKGVGQGLINFAHKFLEAEGVNTVVTYGDLNFYEKVGYRLISEKTIPAPLDLSYPEGWIALSLKGNKIENIEGKSYCVEALNKQVYW